MAGQAGVQFDMFGAGVEESATTVSTSPVMTTQGWQLAETQAFVAALKRGALIDSLEILNRLKIDVAWKVLLEAGFSVGSTTSRANMMAPVQKDIIEAAQLRLTGHELRASQLTTMQEVRAEPAALDSASDVYQIAGQRLGIPSNVVANVVTTSPEILAGRSSSANAMRSNGMAPTDFERFSLGAARIADFGGDFENRYVDYLREFDPAELVIAEAEQGIKRDPSYAKYLQWSQNGHEAPYISVYETDKGTLQSVNRRRTLVAQQMGTTIKAWFGGRNPETGNPLKYGEVLAAVRQAEQERVGQTAIQQQPNDKVLSLKDALTAEQKIRVAFDALPDKTLGKVQPIAVEHNGVTRHFLAYSNNVPSVPNQRRGLKTPIHLATLKTGRLIKADPLGVIVNTFILNGRDQLKETGMPRYAAEADLDQWTSAGLDHPLKGVTQANPPSGIPNEIPKAVQDAVRYALNKLNEQYAALDGVERARGNGHILSLELRDRMENIIGARKTLQEFRKHAIEKGIDPEVMINSLGGEASFRRFGDQSSNAIPPKAGNIETHEIAVPNERTRAAAGGETGVNGYEYKGGQFLPSTTAEPGRWKIGKRWVASDRELIEPGVIANQPTPFSRSILASLGAYAEFAEGQLGLRKDVSFAGTPIDRETMTRLGVRGVPGKEEISFGELVDAYNAGQRWFDVQPDAITLTSEVQAPQSSVGTQAASPANYGTMIKVAADSIELLRKIDVLRVLESNRRDTGFARYIAQERPDLAAEVANIMIEEFGLSDWNRGKLPVATQGSHIGTVVEITKSQVVQDIGRGKLVAHDVSLFSHLPSAGTLVEIGYRNGKIAFSQPALKDNSLLR